MCVCVCTCTCVCMCMYVCTQVAASDQPWVLLLMAAIIRVSLRQELTLLLGPAPHVLEQAASLWATWILLVPTTPVLDLRACATNVQLFMWSNSGPHVCRRERNWVMILWESLKIEMGMRELLSPTVHPRLHVEVDSWFPRASRGRWSATQRERWTLGGKSDFLGSL